METKELWNFVTLQDYTVPSAPVAETVHKGIKRLWRRVLPDRGETASPPPETEQQSSDEFFNQLFASPDWQAPGRTLRDLIRKELATGQKIQVFLGGRQHHPAELLRTIAREEGFNLLEAPPLEAILEHRVQPAQLQLAKGNSVVVIPQLGAWFLRHYDGLEIMRALLEWILKARHPVIIGCDSWPWSYLKKVFLLGDGLPEPRVLAPLDESALRVWFRHLAMVSARRNHVFREASTGKVVLRIERPAAEAEQKQGDGESSLIAHIAASSRGIPEIAWSQWRASILRFDGKMLTSAGVKAVSNPTENTIWVPSWSQLNLPELQAKPGHVKLFLLHNLLLHREMSSEHLEWILPFGGMVIQRALQAMQSLNLVELHKNNWRVTGEGYPAIRSELNDEGYLVDDL